MRKRRGKKEEKIRKREEGTVNREKGETERTTMYEKTCTKEDVLTNMYRRRGKKEEEIGKM